MKKNIWKRLLSLALALVLVAGMLPMTALKAYAAPSEAETIPTSNTGKHAYSENLTVYYKHNNYLYKVVFSNIKDLDTVGLCFASSTSSTLLLAGKRGMYLAPTPEVTTRVDISNFPTQTGSSVNFYLRYNAVNAVNQRNPVVTVTCMGAGDPTWSWNGTSAATAVFTSTDGNATITVGATITSSTQRATSCLDNDKTTYTATATCNGQTYTDTKTVDGAAGPHSYTYSASGDTLTETCSNNCGYSAEATLKLKPDADLTYTGSPITPMEMVYPEGWAGEKKQPADTDYTNNVNVGTNTASCSFTYADGATVSNTFTINPANLSYTTVTLDPASGTYTGSVHNRPTYTLTYNGKQLVEGTDYIVDANWSGDFTNVGSCNLILKGNGNFTGYKTLTYTIHKATPTFTAPAAKELTYNGQPLALVEAGSVNPGKLLYRLDGGEYSETVPTATNAGNYTVYYKVVDLDTDNYNEISSGSVSVTIRKAEAPDITFPTVLNAITYGQKLEEAKLSSYANDYGTFSWNAPTSVPNAGTAGYALDFYPNALALQNYDWKDVGEAQWIAERNALCICPNVTVNKASSTVTAPTSNDLTYNGDYQTLIAPGSATGGTLVYSFEKEDGYTEALPEERDVGTYTVWYKVNGNDNYNGIEPASVTVEIKKADASVDVVPSAVSGLVYNGREQELITSTYSTGGTVYYSLDGINYTESLPMAVNAQEYTVYYKVVGDANHNDMEPKTVTAKIAPWNIETASCKAGVWGGPFTYNGQEHTPTPQIDAWVDDYPVPESPYAPGADVRLTEGTDYTVTYSDNVNAGQAVVTFTGKGNYTGTITRKFTIDPKPITVTIADKTSVYGEAVAELTATDDGIVNNDPNVYALATDASSTANAGTYSITGTALDSNYAITFVGGTYTITKAPVNSIGTDKTVDYTAGMEVDLSQMFSIDENAGAVDYWITHLTGEGSFTSAPYLYRIDKAGTFTVKITTKETANYKSGEATAVLTVNPGDPGIGAVTAGVVNDTLETSAIVLTRADTTVPGTLTVDAEQTLTLGDNTIRYTFTPEDTTNYKVVKGEVTVSVVDTIAPVGTVSIDDNKWNDLWNTITFGLFFKETKTVKVAAEDVLSGIAKVEYYDSATALSADAVKAITAWTDMGADYAQDVTAEDAKTFIYYIRITDKAGNVTYISTADATYDLTKPVISGITNGSIYFTTQKVTVTDKNIDTITLNGEAATDAITLEGNKEATYTIVATDKAGNSTTVTVTMKPIKELAKATENLGNDNVTSADAPALEELVAKLDELIADPDTSDDGERETLEQHKVIAEALLKTIEDVAKATDTENTAKVEDVTADNVTPEDKSNLEDAKADLEDALENNGGNYTEEEKQVIQDEIQRIEDAMVALENVEDVTDSITQLPETVEPDDEETAKKILDAKEAYDELTDHEKSLVDETTKKKLDDLVAALTAYDIIKGDGGKWTKGGSTGLTFTANGPFSKFVGIEVDGKEVDEKYYDAKAGSTIITLKQSYLKRLSTGEHTITVLYTDGETSGTFKILAASSTPATGDNSNIMLYGSMFTVSLAGLVVLLLAAKKRKQETA